MSFKDMVRQDISETFLNPDEFGEIHRLDGKPVCILSDDIELLNREKYRKAVKDDGTSVHQGLIYVRASEFAGLPKTGRQIAIDNMKFIVDHAVSESGIYAITIRAVR